MNDLISKISSYNLFNNLLPGVIFVALSKSLTKYDFVQKDIIIGLFLYYFIGLIISRIGSLIIEPILKFFKIIKYSTHEDYIIASKSDDFINKLLESNNMYRTISSLFVCLSFLKIFDLVSNKYPFFNNFASEFLVIGLLILFIFSYRKQTQLIKKRVDVVLNNKD
jgi:hypothetical protein